MATCPNCKAELMEVNGRYICSECGKEVSAAEINVGTWGDSAQIDSFSATPEPGSASVTDASEQVSEPDDYIEGQADSKVIESTAPEVALAESPHEDGFYTKDDTVTAIGSGGEPVEPVTVSEPVEEATGKNVADSTPTVEASTDPLYKLPGKESAPVPTAEDFYEEPLKPEQKSPVPSGGAALPQDSGIYLDPMEEDAANSSSVSDDSAQIPNSAEKTPVTKVGRESKINRTVLIGGVSAAIVLLVGGIIAYIILGAKSNVDNNSGGAVATETNCDNAGSDSAKQSCIAKAFTACDVTKWSGTYPGTDSGQTRKLDYEIQGTTDNNQCQVDESFVADTVDPSTVGLTMSCLYDNTMTFDKALSTNSADSCSGDLADLIFGTTTTTTDTSTTNTSDGTGN